MLWQIDAMQSLHLVRNNALHLFWLGVNFMESNSAENDLFGLATQEFECDSAVCPQCKKDQSPAGLY